jgi:hypothetical protein
MYVEGIIYLTFVPASLAHNEEGPREGPFLVIAERS